MSYPLMIINNFYIDFVELQYTIEFSCGLIPWSGYELSKKVVPHFLNCLFSIPL